MARKKGTKTATKLAKEENSASENFSCAVSTEERIALLAYTYWEQRGRMGGSPEEDWFRAEKEIRSQMNT